MITFLMILCELFCYGAEHIAVNLSSCLSKSKASFIARIDTKILMIGAQLSVLFKFVDHILFYNYLMPHPSYRWREM